MLNFHFASAPALLCLLTPLLFFAPQIKSEAGQGPPATSPVTLSGGYSSFLYEHGRIPPRVARANFGVVNSSSKTLKLKILRVRLASDRGVSVVRKFTATVCSEPADGERSCVDVKPGRRAAISPHSGYTLTVFFPSSHLRLEARGGRKRVRVECEVSGGRLSAETEMRVERLEPWRGGRRR